MRCKDVVRYSPHLSARCKELFESTYLPPYTIQKLRGCLCTALDGEEGLSAFIDSVCSNSECPISMHAALRKIKKDKKVCTADKKVCAVDKKEEPEEVVVVKNEKEDERYKPDDINEEEAEEADEPPDGASTDDAPADDAFAEWVVKLIKEEATKITECVKAFEEQVDRLKDYIDRLGELTPTRPLRIIGKDPVQKADGTTNQASQGISAP